MRFDEDGVMTAMCLWEAALELLAEAGQANASTIALQLEELREDHGTFTLRQAVMDIVEDCDRAWSAFTGLHGGDNPGVAFDWEFCPEFLAGRITDGTLSLGIEGSYGGRVTSAAA